MAVVINGTTGITSVNGSAAAPSVTGTDTDTGIVYGTNTLSLATGGTSAMTIDSSQNVGVGTTSPTTVLHTVGQNGTFATTLAESVTYTKLRFQNSSVSSLSLYQGVAGATPAWYFQIANGPGTGAYDIALNPFGGNVGIGTASPTQRLSVAGNIVSTTAAGTDGYINFATSGVQNTVMGFNNSGSTNANGVLNNYSYIGNLNGYGIQLLANGAPKATIDTSGNLGVGTTSQNERLRLNSSTSGQARLTIAYADTPISYFGSYSGIVGTGNATDVILTSANVLAFGSGGTTERARIDSSGNLLVGNTTGTSKVTVTGVVESTTGGFKFPDGSTQTSAASSPTAAGAVGTYGYFRANNGNMTAGTSVAGSNLIYAASYGSGLYYGSTSPSGTWRVMGEYRAGGESASVCLRIS